MHAATDYYAVLGLTPQAEDVVIHAAWKVLLRKYHPDTNPDDHSPTRAREINEAFAVLGKPDTRADYDRLRGGHPTIVPLRQPPHSASPWRSTPRRRRAAGPAIGLFVLALITLPTAALALLANPETAPAMRRHLALYTAGRPLAARLAARFEALVPNPSPDPASPSQDEGTAELAGKTR